MFDGVSALLGLCTKPTFQAEAPMRLEDCADITCMASYPINFDKIINTDSIISGILHDISTKVAKSEIAMKFHNSLVNTVLEISEHNQELKK